MSMRNTSQDTFPWAGFGALAVAAAAAGLLLGGVASPAQLLNTWYMTRAAGLVAMVLLWLSVMLGLLQSAGSLKGLTSPLANIDIHNFVSMAALYTTVYHAVLLLFDRYQPFGLSEILVPFASGYKPVLVGLGTLSFYMATLVIVTTVFRAKFSSRVWRGIHQVGVAGFYFALLHGWIMGTDSNVGAVAYFYRFAAISVLVLTAYRVYKGVSNRADTARRG
jgi:predicted ferric reductase